MVVEPIKRFVVTGSPKELADLYRGHPDGALMSSVPHDGEPVMCRWDLSWGPEAINLNPTWWQRKVAKAKRLVGRAGDAWAVLFGSKIAVDEADYWEQF